MIVKLTDYIHATTDKKEILERNYLLRSEVLTIVSELHLGWTFFSG